MKLNDIGTFFLQIPPGLEALGQKELLEKSSLNRNDISLERGGLSVQTTFETALSFNRNLKIPNRILLRLLEFKCRDLPKLFNKVSKCDFKFFNGGQKFTYKITSHESRLFDSRKIESSLQKALEKSFQAYPPKKKIIEKLHSYEDWQLFCRFENDTCTLSLDLSGERLGKRGYKKSSGLAPMRENLAAAMWYFLSYDLDAEDKRNVFDPFAGTGTMLFEAALFNTKTFTRAFTGDAFLKEEQNKQHETRNSQSSLDYKLMAIDQSEQQLKCLNLNNEKLNLDITCHEATNTSIAQELLSNQAIIFTNPPYNKRVSGANDFWKRELEVSRIGIVLPEEDFPKINGYKVLRKLSFKHGGQKVVFKVFERSA